MLVLDYYISISPNFTTIVCLKLANTQYIIGISKESFITNFQTFYDRASKEYIYIPMPFKVGVCNVILQISQAMISDIIEDLKPILVDE